MLRRREPLGTRCCQVPTLAPDISPHQCVGSPLDDSSLAPIPASPCFTQARIGGTSRRKCLQCPLTDAGGIPLPAFAHIVVGTVVVDGAAGKDVTVCAMLPDSAAAALVQVGGVKRERTLLLYGRGGDMPITRRRCASFFTAERPLHLSVPLT